MTAPSAHATSAFAGSREAGARSDCWVEVAESPGGGDAWQPRLQVRSKVEALYGEAIRSLARSVLAQLDAADLAVTIDDRGALPFTLAARLEAAVRRLRPGTPRAQLDIPGARTTPHSPSSRGRPRRTRLYVPGNTPKYFVNAGLHRPDAVVLDLEDSVAPAEKDAARTLVAHALRCVDFQGAETMVRVNALPLGLGDVRAVAPCGAHTLVLPKVEDAREVRAVDRLLDELQREGRIGDVFVIPTIESARGALNAWAIASASRRVVALSIGLEDYAKDIGATRTPAGSESDWARSQVINAARAAGVQPLSSVYSDVDDTAGFIAWAGGARRSGFDGVACLHPRQIGMAHRAFAPTAGEVAAAARVVAAFEAAMTSGLGVATVDGAMVDAPVVERARRTLRLAELSGTAMPG